MKKSMNWIQRIGLLAMILCLFPASIYAAEIPTQAGAVQDPSQILSTAEREKIEQEIARASYLFHLYIVDSLKGDSISTLSGEIFTKWSLGSEDALMVLAMEEREVYIEVEIGGVLDRAIMQSSELRGNDPHSLLLDYYFVPAAADGDFAQAIVSVVRQLDIMKSELENNQVGTNPGSNVGTDGSVPQRNPDPANAAPSSSGISTMVVIAILLLLFIMGVLIYQLSRRNAIKKQKQSLTNLHQDTLGRIHQLEQDIHPLVQFSKGESGTYLRPIKEQHYQLLQSASAFNNELEAFSIPRWATSSSQNRLDKLQRLANTFATTVEGIQSSVAQYKQSERETAHILEKVQSDWKELNTYLHSYIQSSGYPSGQLLKRSENIRQRIEQCADLIEFDPIAVKPMVEPVVTQLEQLEQDITKIEAHAASGATLPAKLKEFKKKLDQQIHDEKLICSEIQPYAFYDSVDDQLIHLQKFLEEGNVIESASTLQRIYSWMEDAYEQISHSIYARDWNESAIRDVRVKLQRFDDKYVNQLHEKLLEIKQSYAKKHWESIPAVIKQIDTRRKQIVSQVSEIIHWNDSNVQFYLKAEQTLKQMLQTLEEVERSGQSILNTKSELDKSFRELQTAYEQAQRELAKHDLHMKNHNLQMNRSLYDLMIEAEQSIQESSRLLALAARDITMLTASLRSTADKLARFEAQLTSAIQEKQKAEKQMSELNRSFESTLVRCKPYIKQSAYQKKYQDLHQSVQQAYQAQDYATVYVLVDQGAKLVKAMVQDYEVKRQQEIAKMRRSHHSGGFGGSLGGGSRGSGMRGSGSGGGSSSWGGDSRGGGSSFGSRSRGGGSSFSRGTRGGKSKW